MAFARVHAGRKGVEPPDAMGKALFDKEVERAVGDGRFVAEPVFGEPVQNFVGAHGAVRLGRMVVNLDRILGVELLCAAQGIEFRAPLTTSAPLARVLDDLRRHVPPLAEDRYMANDLETAADLLRSGRIVQVADVPMPELHA